ncbi:MAG: DUF3630 family protein [Planctomycetes bacterium]|nr:DUF3630 family protein [Planctomycetota bacterium]
MPALPLELLLVQRSASGWDQLLLTEKVSWYAFSDFAESLMNLLGAKVLMRRKSAAEHLWRFEYFGISFLLVFDDFPLGVTIEPECDLGNAQIPEILKCLRR